MAGINKRQFGGKGEKLACEELLKYGYVIIALNLHFGRIGEIDIIAKHGEFLCFIEVKTRTTDFYGMPSESVNYRKQNKIRTLAQIYLNSHNLQDIPVRFDIVEIIHQKKGEHHINIIQDAF